VRELVGWTFLYPNACAPEPQEISDELTDAELDRTFSTNVYAYSGSRAPLSST